MRNGTIESQASTFHAPTLTSCFFFLIEKTSNSLAPTLYCVLGLSTNHEGQEHLINKPLYRDLDVYSVGKRVTPSGFPAREMKNLICLRVPSR